MNNFKTAKNLFGLGNNFFTSMVYFILGIWTDYIYAYTTLTYQNTIYLCNNIINSAIGSIDFKSQYIGFFHPSQLPLSIPSKYFFIKTLTDGNFTFNINNIVSEILSSTFSTLTISTQWIWDFTNGILTNTITPSSGTNINIKGTGTFKDASNNTGILIDQLATGVSQSRLRIYGIAGSTNYLSYNVSNELSYWLGASQKWAISAGGTMSLSSDLMTNVINKYSGTGHATRINMMDYWASATNPQITLNADYIALSNTSTTLALTSKFPFFYTAGDYTNINLNINNIAGSIFTSDWNRSDKMITSDWCWTFTGARYPGPNQSFFHFYNGTTEAGAIYLTSANSVALYSVSDYRMKNNVLPLQNCLNDCLKLRPVEYKFISCCDKKHQGFIAHEVQEVIPNAVIFEKDDPDHTQQMDMTQIIPILVGSIQELNEKVDKQQEMINKQQELIDKQYNMIKDLIILINNKE